MPQLLNVRGRTGTDVSLELTVPINVSADTKLRLRANVDQADLTDPDKSLEMTILRWDEDAGEYRPAGGGGFQFGPNYGQNKDGTFPDPLPDPAVTIDAVSVAGNRLVGQLDIPEGITVRVGLSFDLL